MLHHQLYMQTHKSAIKKGTIYVHIHTNGGDQKYLDDINTVKNWDSPASLSEPQIGGPWTSVSLPGHIGYRIGNCEVEGS
jgi:hypothetical protein